MNECPALERASALRLRPTEVQTLEPHYEAAVGWVDGSYWWVVRDRRTREHIVSGGQNGELPHLTQLLTDSYGYLDWQVEQGLKNALADYDPAFRSRIPAVEAMLRSPRSW
jgi:hypothetical protein